MKRKILALLLCFAMLFSLAPAGAFAEDEVEHYGVWVNGEEFTSTNTQITCGEGTASYDPATNTVTLDNATITNSYTENEESFGIYSSGDLVVKLVGENKIKPTSGTWYAICGDNNVKIIGNGKLTVTDIASNSHGIRSRGDVIISVDSSAEISMMVATYGIQASENTTISGDGTVVVTSTQQSGIWSKNVTISGNGKVELQGHTCGIDAYNGDITISGNGDVKIVGTGGGNGITLGKATWVTQNYNLILSGNSGIVTISGGVGENTVGVSFGKNNQGQVLLNGTASSITLKGGAKAVRYTGSGSPVAGTRIGDYDVTGDPAEASVFYTLKAAAHTHSYVDVVNEPTCTEQGYTTHTCTCGDEVVDSYVDAEGHTEVVDEAVAATCTTTGLQAGSHCSVCGEVIVERTTVDALGHTYGKWATVKEATETEKGLQERVCSVCSAKEQQDIPMLSPAETKVETKPLDAEVVKALTPAEIEGLAGKLKVDLTGKTDEQQKQELVKAIEDTLTTKIVLEVEKLDSTATGTAEKNTTVYDAELVQITTDADGVETRKVVTKEYFKTNGTLPVTVPYPTGITAANANKYQFVVAHMFTVGEKAGELEYPNDIKATEKGLTFTVTGLSPIAISYVEKATKPSSGGSSGGGGGTYAGPTTSTTTVVKPALTMELQIGNKDYKVNNKTYTYDVAPFIAGDRTMVPVRVIMETLGAKVDWNEAARSVTITLDGKVMTMTIGKEIPGYGSAPIIRNDRTYVPIRYIMENTGAKVDWIAATGEIVITK